MPVVVAAIAAVRWRVYALRAPIGMWGRLRRGHLLIPAYDRALTVPIAIAVAGFGAWGMLIYLAVPKVYGGAAVVALSLLIAFCAGPTRGWHRLTGAQHYVGWNIYALNTRTSAEGGAGKAPRRRTR